MPYKDREKRLECQKRSRQKSTEKRKEYSEWYKQTDNGKAAIARGAAKAKAKRDSDPLKVERSLKWKNQLDEWKKTKAERSRDKKRMAYAKKRARDISDGKIVPRKTMTEEERKEARATARRNRKARERAAVGKLSKGIRKYLYEAQQGKCPVCKSKLILDGAKKCHIDHVVPLSAGGTNTDENVQLLCFECNVSKGAKHSVDFMQSRGFLL